MILILKIKYTVTGNIVINQTNGKLSQAYIIMYKVGKIF